MSKIFKYVLGNDQMTLTMPCHAQIRHVGCDPSSGFPCLWTQVSDTAVTETRRFEWFGTGHNLSDEALFGEFLGTAICGLFVWHVFETTVRGTKGEIYG